MEFLKNIGNEVVEASEQVATRLEEGLNILLGDNADGSPPGDAASSQINMEDLEDLDLDGLTEEQIQQLIQDQMMEGSPLEGIAESVMGDIMSRNVAPSSPMEHFQAFRAAINWSETFILSLIAFQALMFMICLWVSRSSRGLTPRICVMLFIAALVRSAETLNGYGNRNWERFATQNYFDKRGIFVGIMLCGPLLLDSFMMLVAFVLEASQLLVQVKRDELRRKSKADKQKKTK